MPRKTDGSKKKPVNLLKQTKTKNDTRVTAVERKLTCNFCGKNRIESHFYVSTAKDNKTGRVGICKDCIKERVYKNGEYDLVELKEILRNPLVDKPFLINTWQSVLDGGKVEKISEYFRQINGSGKEHLRWKHSDKAERITSAEADALNQKNIIGYSNPEAVLSGDNEFNIPPEQIKFWGTGYAPLMYVEFNELWKTMSPSRVLSNGTYIEYLKDTIRCLVLKREALKTGDFATADKYDRMAERSIKMVPQIQTEGSDDYFGGIKIKDLEMTEKFIPLFPDLILDDADMIIFNFVNYIRTLLKEEPVTLGEVKDFTTYSYTRGQEILFPGAEVPEITDTYMYDVIVKFKDLYKKQYSRVMEMVANGNRPETDNR